MPPAEHKHLLGLLRVLNLVALVFSVALFVHYLDPANSGYCSGRSGCEAVRRSGYGYLFGSTLLNLPLVGVASFGAVLALSFVPMDARWRARVLGGSAMVGALAALALIGLQAFAIGEYCWLCLVVDGAALLAGVVGAFFWRARALPQCDWFSNWAWIAGSLVLALAPIGAWQVKPLPPIPEQVLALYEPGKINVVEFADFECPYCRTMYRIFKRLNEEYGDRVNFHQLHMPLPGHPHSFAAAAAAVCAEGAGKGNEMKHLLFTAALDSESPTTHARSLGLDLEAFEACLGSAATARRIEDEKAILLGAGFRGLPTTFVGHQRIVGWRVQPAMKEAYEAALLGDTSLRVPLWSFWLTVAVAVLAVGYTGRVRTNRVA